MSDENEDALQAMLDGSGSIGEVSEASKIPRSKGLDYYLGNHLPVPVEAHREIHTLKRELELTRKRLTRAMEDRTRAEETIDKMLLEPVTEGGTFLPTEKLALVTRMNKLLVKRRERERLSESERQVNLDNL